LATERQHGLHRENTEHALAYDTPAPGAFPEFSHPRAKPEEQNRSEEPEAHVGLADTSFACAIWFLEAHRGRVIRLVEHQRVLEAPTQELGGNPGKDEAVPKMQS
jgi:hypothetical protein